MHVSTVSTTAMQYTTPDRIISAAGNTMSPTSVSNLCGNRR
jgi:hypothetical protein